MVDLYSYFNAIVYLAFGTLKKNCITKANNGLQIKNSFEIVQSNYLPSNSDHEIDT